MKITLQNEKGEEFKMIDKIGFSKTHLNNQDFICIDAYKGQGKNYKEREQKEITICIEGKDLFCGTIFELKELLTLKTNFMTNLKNLLNQKQTLENQLTDLNKQIFETQAIDKFNINLEPIKELQNFKSNNSTLESIRNGLLITLNDSDVNQFLTTFA